MNSLEELVGTLFELFPFTRIVGVEERSVLFNPTTPRPYIWGLNEPSCFVFNQHINRCCFAIPKEQKLGVIEPLWEEINTFLRKNKYRKGRNDYPSTFYPLAIYTTSEFANRFVNAIQGRLELNTLSPLL